MKDKILTKDELFVKYQEVLNKNESGYILGNEVAIVSGDEYVKFLEYKFKVTPDQKFKGPFKAGLRSINKGISDLSEIGKDLEKLLKEIK